MLPWKDAVKRQTSSTKGRLYEGKDGIAGEIGFRYANPAPYREGDFKESAAVQFVIAWHVYRKVL